ncbi:MAG: Protein phosphatase, partial [Candidatus Parcubacteria bacterium]
MARGNAARNHEGAPPIPQRDDDSGKFRRKPGAPGAEEILDADAIGLVEEAEELNDADLEELPDELNPEDLELVEDEPQAVIESRASVKHPGRNEDAALGDLGRLLRERRTPPEIKTSMSQMDAARVTEAMEAEAKVADVLKSKRIFGVLDGISGAVKSPDGKTSKMNEGTGAVASRIASASLSERLAGMPDGATSAQAERLFAEALEDANQDIVQYRDKAYAPVMSTEARDLRKQELSQMGTTATLAMETKGPDGRRMMTIASVGDSRVYKYNRNTKKFSLL